MAIISTVGAVDANSYVSDAEATSYFAGRLNTSAYDTADALTKEKALRMATTYLDARVNWIGDVKDQTTPQALAWPRVYDFYADVPEDILVLGQSIPQDLKNAQCEMALYLLSSGEPTETNSLDSVKVGSLSIDFNEFKQSELIPDHIWAIISYLGNRLHNLPQVKSVALSR